MDMNFLTVLDPLSPLSEHFSTDTSNRWYTNYERTVCKCHENQNSWAYTKINLVD